MTKLQKMQDGEYSSFLRVLFGHESPSPVPQNLDDAEEGAGKIEWFDNSLNDSQREAIKFALASREVALIHGPPGVSHAGSKRFSWLISFVTDWQDSYFDRAHFTDVKARSTRLSLRTI
jgi:hypothetical protein